MRTGTFQTSRSNGRQSGSITAGQVGSRPSIGLRRRDLVAYREHTNVWMVADGRQVFHHQVEEWDSARLDLCLNEAWLKVFAMEDLLSIVFVFDCQLNGRKSQTAPRLFVFRAEAKVDRSILNRNASSNLFRGRNPEWGCTKVI